MFVLIRINDVMFPKLIATFPEKFCFLYSLISCLNGCHSEFHQIKCCSLVRILVNVIVLPLSCGRSFSKTFYFLEMLLGCMNFCHYNLCMFQLY